MTQDSLGNALLELGRRESGTGRLDEAIKAYRQALEEYTRERVPLQWATTQTNLGNALATLGELTSDGPKLRAAQETIETAFEARMQAGQEQHRAYFEARLSEIDRKIADLTQRPGA